MKELELFVSQKNQLEQDKLQTELFKLSRSGRRATTQIGVLQRQLTSDFIKITSKTDHVTEERKNNSFRIMDSSRPRPLSAAPAVGMQQGEETGRVFKDRLGRPAVDISERIKEMNQRKMDRFYHNRIDKLMTMMEEKTNKKKRTKSAPAKRTVGSNIPSSARSRKSNQPVSRAPSRTESRLSSRGETRIPSRSDSRNTSLAGSKMSMMREDSFEETIDLADIPETKVMTKGELDYESKKIRASADKMTLPSGLYGQELGDEEDEGNFNGVKRKNNRPPPIQRFSKPVTFSDSDSSESETDQFRRPRTSISSKTSGRRNSTRPKTSISTRRRTSGVVLCRPILERMGDKIKDFQDKRYPSRSLDPNPDLMTRKIPYPVIVDPVRYKQFCTAVAKVKTTSDMKRELQEMTARYKPSTPRGVHTAWDYGPALKT